MWGHHIGSEEAPKRLSGPQDLVKPEEDVQSHEPSTLSESGATDEEAQQDSDSPGWVSEGTILMLAPRCGTVYSFSLPSPAWPPLRRSTSPQGAMAKDALIQ